jgi:putative DNA primase/helicase
MNINATFAMVKAVKAAMEMITHIDILVLDDMRDNTEGLSIENDDTSLKLRDKKWKLLMGALFVETGGAAWGYRIALKWCRKRNCDDDLRAAWDDWRITPPNIPPGTLFAYADIASNSINTSVNDGDNGSGKVTIRVMSGNRHETWRLTQTALLERKCQVFVRGGMLVEPLWRWEQYDDRGTLIMKFIKYNLPRLADQVARNAVQFQKYNAREATWHLIDPPKDVIETLLTRGYWEFPSAKGIINTPTLRRDGTMLAAPGYDRATGLWYKPPLNFTMPDIPAAPTKADAEKALKLLGGLLDEFPLADKVSISVAKAAMMTPILRGAYRVAPMFFIDKPEAGTGGSYFVELISCLATGRPSNPLKVSVDPKELEKQLSAVAMEGSPILNLNNITFDLESADLCQIVTEGVLNIRPFGKNDELRECDCRAMTVYANGNNISIIGDLVRRVVTARMDAKMECPEQRTFKHKPVDEVLKDRGKYLAAVFTIAVAYNVAGCPKIKAAKTIAGFEEWSKWVQLPLMWLGEADPFVSQEGLRALDPKRAERRARIEALLKYFGGDSFSASDIHSKAMETEPAPIGFRYKHQDLLDAFSKDNRHPSTKGISSTLKMDLRRWVDDYHLEIASESARTHNTYRIWKGSSAPMPQQQVAL